MEIKTIDIIGKEWFDRVNGNSYHSAQVTINFGMADEITIKVPFQYGYGSQFEYSAFRALENAGYIKLETHFTPWRYCEYNNIIYRANITDKCLKRDVVAFGGE